MLHRGLSQQWAVLDLVAVLCAPEKQVENISALALVVASLSLVPTVINSMICKADAESGPLF